MATGKGQNVRLIVLSVALHQVAPMYLPIGKFVVFSMQRSATTTLCNHINSNNGFCAYELLNMGGYNCVSPSQQRFKFMCDHNISADEARHAPRKFVDTFLDHIQNTKPPKTSYGYKVFPGHVDTELLPTLLDENTTCIIHKRLNATAQYRSSLVAKTYNCWNTRGDDECRSRPMHITQNGLRRFTEMRERWYADVERICTGYHTVESTMESFVSSLSSPSPPPRVSELRNKWSNTVLSAPTFLYTGPEYTLSVCTCAKCGSTSLFSALFQAVTGTLYNRTGPPWVQAFGTWGIPSVRASNTRGSVYLQVFRDPVERYISAFHSKIKCGHDLSPSFKDKSDHLVSIMHHNPKLAPFLPDRDCLTMAEYIHFLEDVHAHGLQRYLNEHILPQNLACAQAPTRRAEIAQVGDYLNSLPENGLHPVHVEHKHSTHRDSILRPDEFARLCTLSAPEYTYLHLPSCNTP